MTPEFDVRFERIRSSADPTRLVQAAVVKYLKGPDLSDVTVELVSPAEGIPDVVLGIGAEDSRDGTVVSLNTPVRPGDQRKLVFKSTDPPSTGEVTLRLTCNAAGKRFDAEELLGRSPSHAKSSPR